MIDYIGVVRGILRTLIVIPLMLTPVVVGVIWRAMLNYDFGIVNYFVRLLGFQPIDWIYNPRFGAAGLDRHQRLGWRALCYADPVRRAGSAAARAF